LKILTYFCCEKQIDSYELVTENTYEFQNPSVAVFLQKPQKLDTQKPKKPYSAGLGWAFFKKLGFFASFAIIAPKKPKNQIPKNPLGWAF